MPALEFLLSRLADGLDRGHLDGRAKFIGLASPYVEKITLLRDLVQARVRDLGGMARLPAPAPAFRPESSTSATNTELSPGWLRYCSDCPRCGSSQQRQDLLLHRRHKVFGASAVSTAHQADSEEILVRWQGYKYDDIQQLAQRKSYWTQGSKGFRG